MKQILACICCVMLLSLAGCGLITPSPNPGYTSIVNGTTQTNTGVSPVLYSASPAINNFSNQLMGLLPLAQAGLSATPAAPLAPFIPTASNAILGLLGTLAGAVAVWKNNSANAHAAAAAQMAATLVSTGMQHVAISQAAATSPGAVTTIAQHINNAQSPV